MVYMLAKCHQEYQTFRPIFLKSLLVEFKEQQKDREGYFFQIRPPTLPVGFTAVCRVSVNPSIHLLGPTVQFGE